MVVAGLELKRCEPIVDDPSHVGRDDLSLIDDITITTVNELFLHTQPAHLQKLMGATLDGEERNAARARYLRTRLREAGAHPN